MAPLVEWSKLTPLPQRPIRRAEDLQTISELERLWLAAHPGDSEALESRPPFDREGEFFTSYLPDVESALKARAWVWMARLRDYVDKTSDWRAGLRSRDLEPMNTSKRRMALCALEAWLLLADPAEATTVSGRFLQAYREQLRAMTSVSRLAQIQAYSRAGNICLDRDQELPTTNPRELEALRRHGYLLNAKTKHSTGFYLMHLRPQPWGEIRQSFEAAADYCLKSEGLGSRPAQSNYSYHMLWASLAALRDSQLHGDLNAADDWVSQAVHHFDASMGPDSVMKEGGRWTSRRAIAAENHINEAIRLLMRQDPALIRLALGELQTWTRSVQAAEVSEQKFEIMRIRIEFLKLAADAEDGAAIGTSLAQLRRRIEQDPYFTAHFSPLLDVFARLPRRGRDLRPLLNELQASIRHVDGDNHRLPPEATVTSSLATWARLPYTGDEANQSTLAYTALWRYVRVIVEYLWGVYERGALRWAISIPDLDTIELRTADPTELREALGGLLRALAWGPGKSRAALESLVELLSDQSDATDGNYVDLYSAVVADTEIDLFPTICEIVDPVPVSWPADAQIRRLVGRQQVLTIKAMPTPPASSPYFALNPIMKLLDNPSISPDRHKGAREVRLQSAFTWPRPAKVIVYLEGQSDVGAVSAGLDLYTGHAWRGGSISLRDSGGDRMPAYVRETQAQADTVIIVTDSDKLPGGDSSSRQWNDIWNFRYTFCWSPDLERVSMEALGEALYECFGKLYSGNELNTLSKTWQDKRTQLRCNFGDFLASELKERGIKQPNFGYALGESFMRRDAGGLRELAKYIFALGEGHTLRPHRPTEIETEAQRLAREKNLPLWE
jgi:hypothetical protein